MSALLAPALLLVSHPAAARMTVADGPLGFGFTPMPFVSPANIASQAIEDARKKDLIAHFCKTVAEHYKKFKWSDDPCTGVKWQADLTSKNGHPLVYASFGNGKETTLLLG